MNKNCPIIVAVVGFAILFTGIICSWYAFPKLADYEIAKTIALVEGNEVYELWKKQPFPLKFKVYFFNVTNAVDVQQGANPILKEMGPYIYDSDVLLSENSHLCSFAAGDKKSRLLVTLCGLKFRRDRHLQKYEMPC
ncbi:hypothetical protein ILUMI_19010 [Ignelater luminosus]|uniref:Uncharacterized protein n=1 Tax=Ignelater luminosus TaxID=2038154 RepID=A0A8K0CMI0_IGNLU|nr:hypothetical protein ILUMI_19010 [Ignelater luminosus]